MNGNPKIVLETCDRCKRRESTSGPSSLGGSGSRASKHYHEEEDHPNIIGQNQRSQAAEAAVLIKIFQGANYLCNSAYRDSTTQSE